MKKRKRLVVWVNVDDVFAGDANYGAVYESLGAARQNMRREGGTPTRFVEAPKRKK